ncbi:MAG: lipoate--protein ligase [Firmicutes bacterium]|nr:lipoate--protein ligase [Bacillota bacterium]
MKYIESNSTDPYFNLALEEYVFNELPKDESYFMLWQNANTIVIGKYQNAMEEVNQKVVDERGIKVARRLSGGGAVYHDMGNLNFTFIVDQKDVKGLNFKIFVEPVVETLRGFGVEAEFTGRNDIVIDGMKISGNSQYVRLNRVMHHGCIMLDSDLEKVADALRVKEAKFKSKNSKSVRSRVTTINAHAPEKISMDEFKKALKEHILGDESVEPYELTREDLEAIDAIRRAKYATWEWNYGRAVQYEMSREEKFDAGLVTVNMTAKDGRIVDIKFSGDFFGNGEIEDLEKALKGAILDSALEDKLEAMDLDEYMHGITPAELAGLIRG